MESVRIDKWLWAARFFKTRSVAKDALVSGKVKKDGDSLKPSYMLKVDETLSIRRGQELFEVQVLGLSDQRGPASTAQQLYGETSESQALREQARLARQLEPKFEQRPDKKQRRQIHRFKSSASND